MDGVKNWLTSKGVLGSAVASASTVLMFIGGLLGYQVTPADVTEAATTLDAIQAAALSIIAAGGALVGLWGRIVATKKIG